MVTGDVSRQVVERTQPTPGTAPFRQSCPRGTTVGRYIVLGEIGTGGVGTVYAAYDPELDRKVAIKVMRPETSDRLAATESRGRMQREAQAMARLSHPNVVAVYDVGTFADNVFVAMELIDGQTVKHWWKEEPRTWQQIRDVFVQAARGLDAAHEAGLIHRDFKPENVLVGRDGRVRVLDFGLARAATGEDPGSGVLTSTSGLADTAIGTSSPLAATLTRTGTLLGTPAYMSPEQHLRQPTNERSDQFSFCVSLYEALYDGRPFVGDTLGVLGVAILAGQIAEPPKGTTVPAWLRAHVQRGLSTDPAARFPSMTALIDALTHDPNVRRRRVMLASATALALVGAGAIGYAVSSSAPAKKPVRRTPRLTAPSNLALDLGTVGKAPTDWFGVGMAKTYPTTLVDRGCLAGKCVAIQFAGTTPNDDFGTVMQSFDAKAWRGKNVRFRAHVRVEDGAQAFLWLRVDRPGGKLGYFYNSMDRPPITNGAWTEYEIVGDVADDAESVNYGVMQHGTGRVFVDSTAVDAPAAGTELSGPPKNAELTNLDFESGATGAMPAGWMTDWTRDASIKTSGEAPHGGERCLEIGHAGSPAITQRVDATRWRGKKLHLEASVRGAGELPVMRVVVEGKDPNDEPTIFYDRRRVPVPPMTWGTTRIDAEISASATAITIEVYKSSDDKVWLDDVTITE